MKFRITTGIITLVLTLFTGIALAYDCSELPKWKRQAYYLTGSEVQYEDVAYVNIGEPSKRDFPDQGYPWESLGECDSSGGGGGEAVAQIHRTYKSTGLGIAEMIIAPGPASGICSISTIRTTG